MSLNKFSTSTDYLQKQYLNVGCNDIKCTSLEVAGVPIVPVVNGKYNGGFTIQGSAGSADPGGLVYYEKIGNQLKLSFSRMYTLGTNSNLITFTLDLPPGIVATPSTICAGTCVTNDGANAAHMTNNGTDANGTKVIVVCNGDTIVAGNAFFSGVLTIEV